MRAGWWLVLVVCAAGVDSATVWSNESRPTRVERPDLIDQVMSDHKIPPVLNKLGRGAANFTMGWLEVPLHIGKQRSKRDTGGSFFTGLAYGLIRGVARTGVGAYEILTFLVPYPEDYAPVLPPVDYFRKDIDRDRLPFE